MKRIRSHVDMFGGGMNNIVQLLLELVYEGKSTEEWVVTSSSIPLRSSINGERCGTSYSAESELYGLI
jgi:hypothetical protein